MRSGLSIGATRPVWPLCVAKQYARPLIAVGVEPQALGVRFIYDEYPLYRPDQDSDMAYYFDQGYMTLPPSAASAIAAAKAVGRQVTVLMVGPQGCGKTEVAKTLRQGLARQK